MQARYYILGAVFALALAIGQILFKLAAGQLGTDGEPMGFVRSLFSLPMISACTLYAASVILYTFILREVPLSRAFLFSLAGSALVPLLAFLIFKEAFTVRYAVGAALMLVGLSISLTG